MQGLTSLSDASRAYQKAAKVPAQSISPEPTLPSRSFSDMVEQTATNTLETIRDGDRAAVAGLKGEMSTQQVVEATMAMESALQVTVAVRDKVIEAYQEVLRMAV